MAEEEAVSKRPLDTPFRQQRLPAWQPVLTPVRIIVIFLTIGIIFIPTGVTLSDEASAIQEQKVQYGGPDNTQTDCTITTANQNRTCSITFDIGDTFEPPIYVYYELENYYQNHRKYVSSRNAEQLMGTFVPKGDLSDFCDPLTSTADGKILNPCGLIANSFFNDVISVTTSGFIMNEADITWESDDDKFQQPEGFKYEAANGKTTDAECQNIGAGYKYDSKGDYCFFYPNADTTKYLYETYPQISPIKGVEDEHFKVWMKTAALPTFRKLYGKITTRIPKGTKFTFNIDNNFEVNSYDAKKSIVLSKMGQFGGKNTALGVAYIVVGTISLLLGWIFLLKQLISPRRLGSTEDLKWE